MSIQGRTCASCKLPLTTAIQRRADGTPRQDRVLCHDATILEVREATLRLRVPLIHPMTFQPRRSAA